MPHKDPIKRSEYGTQYRKSHKLRISEQHKQYRQLNKEEIRHQKEQYQKNNAKKISEYKKQYNEINKRKVALQKSTYVKNNPQKVKDSQIKYRTNNPDRILQSQLNYLTKLGFPVKLSPKTYKHALSAWSKTVKKLGNGLCQICPSPATISHHILHKSKYPGLSLNVNNGISLCDPCHYESHGWAQK